MIADNTWAGIFLGGLFGFLATWVIAFLVRLVQAPAAIHAEDAATIASLTVIRDRKAIKAKLQGFYVTVGPLIDRNFPKDTSVEAFDQYVAETNSWLNGAAAWIQGALGEAALAKFLDRSGMSAHDYKGVLNDRHNNVIRNLTRHRQNLATMIETDAWS